MFVNNSDFFIKHEVIENVITSDHAFNILTTNLSLEKSEDDNVNDCIYSTRIIEYNLMDAETEEWLKLKDKINNAEWNLIVNSDRDNNDIDRDFNSKCEELVMSTMRRKDDMSEKRTINGDVFKSSNKIPRDVRRLFKQKRTASKALRISKSAI